MLMKNTEFFFSGRGKMKKIMLPLLLAIGAKVGIVFPIIAGGVALLASKALIISKIALALAVILVIQAVFTTGSSVFGLVGKVSEISYTKYLS